MTAEEKGRANAQERGLFKTDRFLNDQAEIILKSFVNQTHISKTHCTITTLV